MRETIGSYTEIVEGEYEGIPFKATLHWGEKSPVSFLSIYNDCLAKEQKRKMDSLCQRFDSWLIGMLDGTR
jgi:hypothetical protein